MFEAGDTIVVAVSGGPDSMCLLDVLERLAPSRLLRLEVAHVDHGLSDASAEISAKVASHAAAAGLDAHVVRISGLEGPNLHARAREIRYTFFQKVAEETEAVAIATAHTLDDRVETTLARLIHGGGPRDLAGLSPISGGRIRPLISVRRRDTRAYCEELGIEFYDDPSNLDPRFDRAEIRSRLVPVIEERWGEGAMRAIANSAERAGEEAGALDSIAAGLMRSVRLQDDDFMIERDVLNVAPRALRRRLLEAAAGRVRDLQGALDEALDWMERETNPGDRAHFDLPGGGTIDFEGDKVRVRPSKPEDDPD